MQTAFLLSDGILLFLVALPAILAWALPQLRKRNGNFLIALKIVPVGIFALFLADKLIFWFYQWFCEYKFENIAKFHISIRFGIPIVIALAAITVSGWIIHKKFRVECRYDPLPSLLLFFPALLAVSILDFMISMATLFNTAGGYRSEWRSIYLPQENGVKIAFENQSIHPMLAEYNYRLRFIRNGQTSYQLLFSNCGGRTHFNLYRLKDGRLLFRDKDWDYIVDVRNLKIYRLEFHGDKQYIAPVPNEEINSWGGLEERNGKIVLHMGRHNIPAEEVSGILDGMVYYGCIKDKFYPASEKPEEQIQKRR